MNTCSTWKRLLFQSVCVLYGFIFQIQTMTMSVKTEKTGGEYIGVADWVLFMYGLESDPLLREI